MVKSAAATATAGSKPKAKPKNNVQATEATYLGRSTNIFKTNGENHDLCSACKLGEGQLLLCDFDQCPLSFHSECLAADQLPNPKRPTAPWFCPAHPCQTKPNNNSNGKDAAILPRNVVIKVEQQSGLGSNKTLGRLMQHWELLAAAEDQEEFRAVVCRVVEFAKSRSGGSFTQADFALLLLRMGNNHLVGEILRGFHDHVQQQDAGVGQSLVTMGIPQPCLLCKAKFRVLRTCCLECGAKHVFEPPPVAVLLPKLARDSSTRKRSKLAAATAAVLETEEERRVQAAFRGLEHFEQICSLVEPLNELGDVTFLAYKMWIAMRFTVLESRSRACCERIAAKFLLAKLDQHEYAPYSFSEEMEMPELLDTCEGLHVLHRMLVRGEDEDEAHPKLAQDHIPLARVLVADLTKSAKSKLVEFHVSDLCGFDPAAMDLGCPQTPREHCSNCGHNNVKEAAAREKLLACAMCSHKLTTKFDYGSMTDAVVWSFVFGSIGLRAEFHAKLGQLTEFRVDQVLRLLPETRAYKELEELGEDFYKLQCYFITHFIYVMSDWGEQRLVRAFYEEEFRFIAGNLVHVLRRADAEILGEFIHCLYILGYEPGSASSSSGELDALLQECIAFLLEEEEDTFGKCGAWTSAGSVNYARYHSAWCGVVGLIPRARRDGRDMIICADGLAAFPPCFL